MANSMVRSARDRAALVAAVALAGFMAASLPTGADEPARDAALRAEQAEVTQWRAARAQSLTSDTGWLNLVGLLWLNEGENSFGRGASQHPRARAPGTGAERGYLRHA